MDATTVSFCTVSVSGAEKLTSQQIIKMFKDFANNTDSYGVQEEARDYMEHAVSAIEVIYKR